MAYERSWQFLPVQGPRLSAGLGDAPAYYLWMLKSFLKGEIGGATQGLWTCAGSASNASSNLTGTDLWGTSYNSTLIPYSDTTGGAHGWIVLQRNFTVNSIPFTVSLLLSNHSFGFTNGGFVATKASTNAPSGGSLTADPTLSTPFFTKCEYASAANLYALDTTSNRRYYGGLTSLGDFWFAETLGGEIVRGHYFAVPVGAKTNDQYPFFASSSEILAVSGSSLPTGQAFMGGNIFTRAAAVSALGATPGNYYNGATGYPALMRPEGSSATVSLLDVSDTSLFDYPAFVVVANASGAATGVHSRGRLPDTGLCSSIATGTTNMAQYRPVNVGTAIRNMSNDVEYVTLNAMIVPYNATLS